MEDSKTLFCSLKSSWAHEGIYSKSVDNLCSAFRKFRHAWSKAVQSKPFSRQWSKTNVNSFTFVMSYDSNEGVFLLLKTETFDHLL
jgi:hypothetical protein